MKAAQAVPDDEGHNVAWDLPAQRVRRTSLKKRYPKPPVVEALCEVYFRASQWDATIPGLFYDRIRDRFPKKSERREVEIELEVARETMAAKTRRPEARAQFSDADGSRMLQVGCDLLVVNQLRPYPQFEEWRPVVVDAVSLYRELAKPAGVARIGMRYINRIEVPGASVKMEDYFDLYPEIPTRLGSSHGSFMLRIQLFGIHQNHQLIATFGSAPPQEGREANQAWVLDLYDVVTPSGDDPNLSIERHLDEAHENIERAFESIITDSTRALFEENV